MSTGHAVVDEISQIRFQGNIIPELWYRNLTFENKKPHFVAITILAEIVYWYRSTIVRDEKTGEIIKEKKKFHADMLQRSYTSFEKKFGFSNRQAKAACDFLVEHGLIRKEFRTVRYSNGVVTNNVLFLEPIPENIRKITYEEYNVWDGEDDVEQRKSTRLNGESFVGREISFIVEDPAAERIFSFNRTDKPSTIECNGRYIQKEEGPTFETRTNTYNTTEISTNNLTKSSSSLDVEGMNEVEQSAVGSVQTAGNTMKSTGESTQCIGEKLQMQGEMDQNGGERAQNHKKEKVQSVVEGVQKKGNNTQSAEKSTQTKEVDSQMNIETLFTFFEQNGFGKIGSYISSKISSWCSRLSGQLVMEAMKLAVEYGSNHWRYIETILQNWQNNGLKTVEEIHTYQQNRTKNANRRGKSKNSSWITRTEPVPDWLKEGYRHNTQNNLNVDGRDVTDAEFQTRKRELEERLKRKYGRSKGSSVQADGSRILKMSY